MYRTRIERNKRGRIEKEGKFWRVKYEKLVLKISANTKRSRNGARNRKSAIQFIRREFRIKKYSLKSYLSFFFFTK